MSDNSALERVKRLPQLLLWLHVSLVSRLQTNELTQGKINRKATNNALGIDNILDVIRKLSSQDLQIAFQKVPTKDFENYCQSSLKLSAS
jgi:hypothetical protein